MKHIPIDIQATRIEELVGLLNKQVQDRSNFKEFAEKWKTTLEIYKLEDELNEKT